MSSSKQYTATLPLLLSTRPVPGSPELPGVDSPESLLLTMYRMTGAHFPVNDLPIDAINTALIRNQALNVGLQFLLEDDRGVAPEVLIHMAWAAEGLASEAQTIFRMWGRHGTIHQEGHQASHQGAESGLND